MGVQVRVKSVDWGDFGRKVQDINPLLKRFQLLMLRSVQKTFNAQGRPAWKPNSEATLKARRKGRHGGAGRSQKIGINTGRFYRSFGPTYTGPDQSRSAGRRGVNGGEAKVASNVPYGVDFVEGVPRGRIENVPAGRRRISSRKTKSSRLVNVKAHTRRSPGQPARPIDLVDEDADIMAQEAVKYMGA